MYSGTFEYVCNIYIIFLRIWICVCVLVLLLQMIQDMASSNKGEAPDMGDLSDVSVPFW